LNAFPVFAPPDVNASSTRIVGELSKPLCVSRVRSN
jgi:hypothetical protein